MYPNIYPPPSAPPSNYDNNVKYDFNRRSYQSENRNHRPYQLENRNHHTSREERMVGFQEFIDRYEINATFASRLLGLDGYDIVLICDDSGSMNAELNDVSGPYNTKPTRWDELKQTVSIVVDLATVLDPDGIDIYFLNREPKFHVRSSKELPPMFARPPKGLTPIVPVMRRVLRDKKRQIQQGKLLLLIATDGQPTDDQGHENIAELRYVLKHERKSTDKVPVTIIACTDDNDSMSYLNNWDKEIPNLDVVDDYKSEREEILRCQGKSFPFSFGDYVVKILMGAVDSWFDQLDEVRVFTDEYGRCGTTNTLY